MRQCSVDTPAAEGVRVRLRAVEDLLGTNVSSPDIGIREEEPLLWREAVHRTETFGFGFSVFVVLERLEGYLQSAVVGNVLTECEGTVGVYAGSDLYAVECCRPYRRDSLGRRSRESFRDRSLHR